MPQCENHRFPTLTIALIAGVLSAPAAKADSISAQCSAEACTTTVIAASEPTAVTLTWSDLSTDLMQFQPDVSESQIPEPSSLWLMLCGFATLLPIVKLINRWRSHAAETGSRHRRTQRT